MSRTWPFFSTRPQPQDGVLAYILYSIFYILYSIFCILYSIFYIQVAHAYLPLEGIAWRDERLWACETVPDGARPLKRAVRPEMNGVWKPPLGLVSVFLKWDSNMLVGSHGSSLSLIDRVEVVCEGASQGWGPGRPIAEAHNHDMTNTEVRKSGCAVEH